MVLLFFGWNVAYYRLGIYIDLDPDAPVTTFMTTDEDTIYTRSSKTPLPGILSYGL